ncbi:MAG TPA: endo alpha-1,4 polygalactosaminidase [Solirubrobacterales bacterium]
MRLVATLALSVASLAGAGPAAAAGVPDPLPCDPAAGPCWDPAPTTEPWQIQLQGRIDLSVPAPVYDIDADSGRALVEAIHAQGDRAICYISAGSWEPYRADAGEFPKRLLGRPIAGFEEERWLDIRRIGRLRPIIEARMDECAAKGFDAIDPDNVDGYRNRTGFPLGGRDQLAYNSFVANAAHERGLAVGLKNDLGQARRLLPYFDFAVNEQCFQYRECDRLDRFVAAAKPVYGIEYEVGRDRFCATSLEHGFSTIFKRYGLRAFREAC